MSKLIWDDAGSRKFQTGVNHGVVYPMATPGVYGTGVAWNGLTKVSEKATGAEVTSLYADNVEYAQLMSQEKFEGSIEAYMYPDEFGVCDGSASLVAGVEIHQQKRKKFALCYETIIGNDNDPEAGKVLHIIYGCLAKPAERGHATVNESPEAMTLSWDISATPVEVAGFKPSATVSIDSTKVAEGKFAAIEAKLFGTDAAGEVLATEPTLLLPNEIAVLVGAAG